MQRLIFAAALAGGLLVGLGALVLRAQDLPPALVIEYDLVSETVDRVTREGVATGPAEARATQTMHVEFALSELAATPEGTRARLTIRKWTGEQQSGSGDAVTKEPLELHLAGVTVQVLWGADDRLRLAKVLEGTAPPEELKLIEDWNAEELFGRRRLAERKLEAGERWKPDARPVRAEVSQPSGAPPGIEDWKETTAPPTGELDGAVERVEGDLVHLRWKGEVACERKVSGRAGDARVSGTVVMRQTVDDAWVVDRPRRLPILRRNVRTLGVSGQVGGTTWVHTSNLVEVWKLVP